MLVGASATAVDIFAAHLVGNLQKADFVDGGQKGRFNKLIEIFSGLATQDEINILKDKSIDARTAEKQEILHDLNLNFLRFVQSSFEKLEKDVPPKIARSIKSGARFGFSVIETRLTELDAAAKSFDPAKPLIVRDASALRQFRESLKDSS